ncbi:glucose-6-phosphate isomerase [Sinanaerobacter sp. ZZT-01]|uniref:glucose-6-phosphate isomerase n=1 Tax=Sinanaerobacter sp. ZZT-01 TaxID=3111540 RepID=UPI002D77CC98|nr:glucose-6-phosphate isomerase [Sinanaerobacter sp. ZZT-01]WRR94896.1 glucose-6-phosphate isomerase [Sinanaerobacter sp. ZZT-01]
MSSLEIEALSIDLSMVEGMGHIKKHEKKLIKSWAKLKSGAEAFTDWVDLPLHYDKEEIRKIKQTAQHIHKQCNAFVVIGIGGSYLGARAAIEMLHSESESKNVPKVYFAGNNLSGTYHCELLEALEDKEVCICVISKSGTTTETSVAFALLKEFLIKKYGKKGCRERIYAVTDQKRGILRCEVEEEGYQSFAVPQDIGGRYSVLSAVGLLPIAVAGIDIREMLDGAADMATVLAKSETAGEAGKLAAARNELYQNGKVIEIFECYEPKLYFFTEWLKQLFGESEGKEGKGIFPSALQFSTELHSMGQFLQQGNQIFFETILSLQNPKKDLKVPKSAGEFLAGRSINEINNAAMAGVIKAHQKEGISMIKVDIPFLNAYHFGQMVYFFETTCALSGYLLGINPFDQPGVDSYKLEMRKALTK